MANLLSSTLSNASTKTPTARSGLAFGDPAAPGGEGLPTASGDSASAPAAAAPPSGEEESEVARRLRAQYAEISQLAGGLAHEIKNPLSTVLLNLGLLAEDFQHPETPRDRRALERIERLRHEIQRLSAILDNFLSFARIQELNLKVVDLNTVVEELRDFFEPHAATKSIVLRTRLAPELPPVRLDPELFKQALLNLWLNAEYAMPSGGDLILMTRREGPTIVLDVIDTGVGMTEEVRARIFDAFFSTRPGGSGLGLPTTRKIVEAHRGTIRAQSEPGKGSQFTIRLPIAGPAAPALGGLRPPDGPISPQPDEGS